MTHALQHRPAPPLQVALVQSALVWHDPAANRDHLAHALANLTGATDLIVLPEMFSTGFTMRPEQAFETMDGETVAWMRMQARTAHAVVCGSLAMRVHDRFVNRFLWVRPDGELQHYDKRHLFRMSGEHEHYASGGQRLIVELNGWRVCPLVCYDLRFPVWSRNRDDYDLLLYVANWPAPRQLAWETLLRARAIENLAYVVGVNRIGSDGNGFAFAGGSSAIGPSGEQLLHAGRDAVVQRVALDAGLLVAYRAQFPAWRDADAFTLDGL